VARTVGPGNIPKKHKAKGLISFGALVAAAEIGDWQAASLHCERPNKKHSDQTRRRNAWTKALFEQADREARGGGH
jgi:hypothetical protein